MGIELHKQISELNNCIALQKTLPARNRSARFAQNDFYQYGAICGWDECNSITGKRTRPPADRYDANPLGGLNLLKERPSHP
jgi:hypothetical protein